MIKFVKIMAKLFILAYLMCAFIKADINFINWDEETRGCLIMSYIVFGSFLGVSIMAITEKIKENE